MSDPAGAGARADAPSRDPVDAAKPDAGGAAGAVVVEICGQKMRLACEPGQEARVRGLADQVDRRARGLAASGVTPLNTPLTRILLMAALVLADELDEAEQRLAAQGAGDGAPADSEALSPAERAPADALDHAFARILIDAAQRLEGAAARLESG